MSKDAKILREIAEALRKWEKGGDTAVDTARKVITLFVDNLGLVRSVQNEYGCHAPLERPVSWLRDIARKRETINSLSFEAWWTEFTQPQLWAGERLSVADQCEEWASRLEGRKSQSIKAPSKDAIRAYLLLKSLGCSQAKAAEIMSGKLKRTLTQGCISRYKTQCERWLKANGLDVFPPDIRPDIPRLSPDKLGMGARTDGRRTGDPRHKRSANNEADE